MKNFRILVTADFFYPDQVGGASIVVHELNKRLIRDGVHIDVITRSKDEQLPVEQIAYNQHVYRLQASSKIWTYPITLLQARSKIKQLLAASQYDCLIAHHAYLGYVTSQIAYQWNKPFIFYFHGPWHREAMFKDLGGIKNKVPAQYKLRAAIDRYTVNKADRIVVLSHYMKHEVNQLNLLPDYRFSIIPGGVDTQRFQPVADRKALKAELGLQTEYPCVLTVRRLDKRMGLENLIRAFHLLDQSGENFYLAIGGNGPLMETLQDMVISLRLESKVKLLGFISEEDLPKYYASADLFVLPSLALEGFGLSTVEALASGTPVLGTDSGGTPEILAELGNEFILKDAQPETIAQRIRYFFENLDNAETRQRMCNYAQKFTWDQLYHQQKQMIESVIARSEMLSKRLHFLGGIIDVEGDVENASKHISTAPLDPKSMNLSIVICSLGKVNLVEQCLESIIKQGILPLEVIIVNQGEKLPERLLQYPMVKEIMIPPYGASIARNTGIKYSKGEWLFFSDDDAQFGDNFFSTLNEKINHYTNYNFFSTKIVDFQGKIYSRHMREKDTKIKINNRHLASGSAFCIHRAFFNQVGNFDPDLGPGTPFYSAEDVDLVLRGICEHQHLMYLSSPTMVHPPIDLANSSNYQVVRRKFCSYALGDGACYAKHHLLHKVFEKNFRSLLGAGYFFLRGNLYQAKVYLSVTIYRILGYLKWKLGTN